MKTWFLLLSLLLSLKLLGQDKVHFKDGRVIHAKVTEIGLSEIKYKKSSNLQGPNYVAAKSDVLKIEYENGSVDFFEDQAYSPSPNNTPNHYYQANKIEAEPQLFNRRDRYKHGVSSILLGPTIIGAVQYDYFITNKWNISAGIGLIGIYAGADYHFGGDKMEKNATPFIGLKATAGATIVDFNFGTGAYLPVGVHIVLKDGIVLAPHVAAHYTYIPNTNWFGGEIHAVRPWLGFLVGFRFQ